MAHTWDPRQYLTFGDQRSRGLVDLLAHVAANSPSDVVDLGCGPGNSTALLAARWPGARICGVDSSPEMIERAKAEVPSASFEVADLQAWLRVGKADVVFTNATLQWVPGHLALMPELVRAVRTGGWLAIGVPGNFGEPSHRLRGELAQREPYAAFTATVASPSAHDPEVYLRALRDLGCEVDVWETTYLHQLDGPDAVFEWVSGTSARPALQALPEDLRERFADELRGLLREAYPAQDGVVVLPFRRVFVVARVP